MEIKALIKIYTEGTMDIARTLLRSGIPLDDDVTTMFKDEVNIRTHHCMGAFGLRVWNTIITGGPHHHTEETSTNVEEALRVHWSWMHRHETGRFLCTTCDGHGELACSTDRVVWGAGGIAGHTTDDWTEDCTDCDDEGMAADEDLCGMYIENGVLVGE